METKAGLERRDEALAKNSAVVFLVPFSLERFLIWGQYGCQLRVRTELTLRKRIPVLMPIMKKAQATMFGRAKGYLIRNLLCLNSPGRPSAGLAKNPPKEGPKMDPKFHTRGMTEKARGCSSFSGTNSATIVRMIPTVSVSKRSYEAGENLTISIEPTSESSCGDRHRQAG